jgi:hypothetical protein
MGCSGVPGLGPASPGCLRWSALFKTFQPHFLAAAVAVPIAAIVVDRLSEDTELNDRLMLSNFPLKFVPSLAVAEGAKEKVLDRASEFEEPGRVDFPRSRLDSVSLNIESVGSSNVALSKVFPSGGDPYGVLDIELDCERVLISIIELVASRFDLFRL